MATGSSIGVGASNITTLGTITTGVWNGTVLTGTYGGTGVNNGASTITIGGNVTFSGAFTFAGTVTGNTAVTFPTSGTLCTTTGSTSITTLGTVTTGTWNASIIALAYGGTNANLVASNGGIFYSTGSAGAILAGTATANRILLSGASTTPAWSTATYPATTTINQLLYSSAANVIAGLATANSGTLVTSSAGVPSILALGAQQSIVGIASGTPAIATVPGKNRLINGDFMIWQRGAYGSASIAVAASTTKYTADRWQCSVGASTATTVAQIAGTTASTWKGRVQRNSGQTGTAVMRFCQSLPLDMCGGAAGNKVTLSFKAACGANFSPTSNNITVTVYSGTGASSISGINGAFTGTSSVISQTQALTTTLTGYSFTSSALGSTVTQLAVQFSWTPTGTASTNDWAEFTDVQLEVSDNQTAFERKSYAQTWWECQRFYYKTFYSTTAPAQNVGVNSSEFIFLQTIAGASTNYSGSLIYPTPMINNPTVTLFSPGAATAQVYNESAGAGCTGSNLLYGSPNQVSFLAVGSVGSTVGQGWGVHITSEGDLT